MTIYEWAQKHGYTAQALRELEMILNPAFPQGSVSANLSETDTQSRARLAIAEIGGSLMRNNSGAARDQNGRMVRYGLANDSKRINEEFKSHDLIGITPVQVQQHHIGRVFGVFTAYECKHPKWTKPESKRDKAQENFAKFVRAKGGISGFLTHESQITRYTMEYIQ